MGWTETKRSWRWDFRRSFAFVCVFVMCILTYYLSTIINKQIYIVHDFLKAHVNLSTISLQNGTPSGTVNESVYERYREIREEYHKKLTSIPINTFKASALYLDYGEPVKNFFPTNSSKIKRILAWTSFYGSMDYIPMTLQCDHGVTCEVTYDRNDLLTSDAVVMHARNLGGINDLPAKRLPHQRWVYFVLESPYHVGQNPRIYNGIFNYTVTYRYDSDAQIRYFSFYKRQTPLLTDQFTTLFQEIMESKSKLVSYMNSNCGAPHTKRLSYTRDLQTHIPVDMYGKCGTKQCPHNSPNCMKTMSSYKFYLSMENSNCRNYVTEKSSQPLFDWRAVPIVMGGADPSDYERALPPGSYIHTSGFNSAKELAEYLLILDKNPTLYERYHEWRKDYTGLAQTIFHEGWCNLCLKISNGFLPVQSYRDFIGWYNQDTCRI